MGILKLHYPVCTLKGETILPAGTRLTDEIISKAASSGLKEDVEKFPVLDFGTVRQDIFYYIDSMPAYRRVFGSVNKRRSLLELMKDVRFPKPLLETLDYFKQYDAFTYRHMLMVFALTTHLAGEFLGDYREVINEAIAGPFHDIGKICIPLEVLKKEHPLTKEELTLLRHHTIAGYILLIYYFKDTENFAAQVARDHHEKCDGSGYPNGVNLDNILVEIVAVSDMYDAILSPRPYRPTPYVNRTALEEITRMAEKGEIKWEILRALIASNRSSKPHHTDCVVSKEKRGSPPADNFYGVYADDD